MMFSSTRLWVAVAAVATASCAWINTNTPGSSYSESVRQPGSLAIPVATVSAIQAGGRMEYDGRSGAHYFNDVSEGLYYTYTDKGFSFRPASKQAEWNVNLALGGVCRQESQLKPATEPVVSVAPTEMLIDAGSYAVEYTRTSEGMRQNFLIREQLPGCGPLTVELECKSDLSMCLAGEDALLFFDKGQSAPVASYSGLHVWDAAGRVLESHMEIADNTVRLVVDDANALYPVTVDPLISSVWNALGIQGGEKQGWTVAGGRDVNGDGYFDVVVGSPFYDRNGNSDIGCVRVYLGVQGGISTTANYVIHGVQAGSRFGWSVAFAGDINNDGYADVLVGAPLYDGPSAADGGKVYAYYGSASGLSTTANWTYESSQAGAELGTSVAGAGRVNNDNYSDIIVGAPKYSNGDTREGRAYVFGGAANGLSVTPDWIAESNQEEALFGMSVAGAGDVNNDGYCDVIIGAPGYSNGSSEEGRAFMYVGSSGGLGGTPAWTAESNQANADFGMSVAGAGDVNNDGYSDVLVGAPRYDHGQTNEGRVYLYLGGSSGVASTEVWTTESNQTGAAMGTAVASAGDVDNDGYDDIMAGAPYYDAALRADAGLVVIYGGSSTGIPASCGSVEGENGGDLFGYTLACAAKINNNNMADIIVGSPAFSSVLSDGGKASILDDPDLVYSKRSAGEQPLPAELSVYPNPSQTGGATVEFTTAEEARVEIEVVDYTGAVVYTKDLGVMVAGHHSAVVPHATVSAGAYFVRIAAGSSKHIGMMRVMR